MPIFRYSGRSSEAGSVDGVLEADSSSAAAGQLVASGITPVRIEETRPEPQSVKITLAGLRKGRTKSTDLALLSRQMYSLTRAGVPILRAIVGVAESAGTPELRMVLQDVHEALRTGRTLAAALQRHPDVFPRLFVSIVQVGEESGTLEESFNQLSEYYELEDTTRQRVKAAVRYPTIVICTVAVAVGIINRWVIPSFATVFEGAGVDLPLATRGLIATSDLTVRYWPYLVVGIGALVVGTRMLLNTDAGRMWKDRAVFRIPVLGSIMERAVLSRFARSYGIASRAGVPILQCLSLTSHVVDNAWVGSKIREMGEAIPRGASLSRAAASSGLFTPLAMQMITVGEETGEISELMMQLASFYEREVEHESQKVGDLLEPLMVVLVGGIVLVLALGVYLPMWDLATAASN